MISYLLIFHNILCMRKRRKLHYMTESWRDTAKGKHKGFKGSRVSETSRKPEESKVEKPACVSSPQSVGRSVGRSVNAENVHQFLSLDKSAQLYPRERTNTLKVNAVCLAVCLENRARISSQKVLHAPEAGNGMSLPRVSTSSSRPLSLYNRKQARNVCHLCSQEYP